MKSSVLHPTSDSRNWPRSSKWINSNRKQPERIEMIEIETNTERSMPSIKLQVKVVFRMTEKDARWGGARWVGAEQGGTSHGMAAACERHGRGLPYGLKGEAGQRRAGHGTAVHGSARLGRVW